MSSLRFKRTWTSQTQPTGLRISRGLNLQPLMLQRWTSFTASEIWLRDLRFPCRFFFGECSCFSGVEELLSIDAPKDVNQFGNQTSPAGLVASAKPGAVVSMEILVEQNVIFPLRITLELLGTSVDWTPPAGVSQKNPG